MGVALAAVVCLPSPGAEPAHAVPPVSPAPAAVDSSLFPIGNEKVGLDVRVTGNTFADAVFHDKVNGRSYRLGPDIFALMVVDEEKDLRPEVTIESKNAPRKEIKSRYKKFSARDFMARTPSVEKIPARPDARRLADRRPGQRVTVPFVGNRDGLALLWTAEVREGSPYVRLSLKVEARHLPAAVRVIRLLDLSAPDGRVMGSVKGAPVTASGGTLFAGVEHPMSVNRAEKDGRIQAQMERRLDIPACASVTVSAVVGVAAPGQLRRAFQVDYLNQERARPYGAFLNYNTWYDIGYFDRYSEKKALDVINTYGRELVKKRGVVMDSFMMDDGWDDTETLWKFNKDFPDEFHKVRQAAESFGAAPGVWLSPWGGYGDPRNNRLKAANGKFETNEVGFALAGSRYYNYFRDMCVHMIRENGVNHFKFDGTSSVETQVPGSRFSSDFEAIIHLIEELRGVRPDLYVNLTTGTWASPFWFGIADSIWRGNWDHEFRGEGTPRNQWMTFRDAKIYENNVEVSPLFPVNSLMTHGVIYTKRAHNLEKVEGDDLKNEIWSGFGSGTQMQEIYVSPGLLTQDEWDTLAAAAKWTRANGDTLVDTHWIGGSPADMEVYGWASWSPRKGILTLRNPSSRTQTVSFDPAAVFELPAGAPAEYRLSSPKGDSLPAEVIRAGTPFSITLQPFEVLVLEAVSEKQDVK